MNHHIYPDHPDQDREEMREWWIFLLSVVAISLAILFIEWLCPWLKDGRE